MSEYKSSEEKLSEILDIAKSEKIISENTENPLVKEVKIKRKDQVRQDFDSARKNMKELINKGFESLDGIMKVAEAGDSPRAYEVASILIKTISEVNTDLMNIHKTTADALGTNKVVKNTTNNSIFVGSTAELQKLLRGKMKEIEKLENNGDIIDAE